MNKKYIFFLFSLILLSSPVCSQSISISEQKNTYLLKADSNNAPIDSLFNSIIDILCKEGGTIRFSSGTFFISDQVLHSIVIKKCKNITIEGNGYNTILKNKQSSRASSFITIKDSKNITIKNLHLYGDKLPADRYYDNTTNHCGIQVYNSENIDVKNCAFKGFFTGGIRLLNNTNRILIEDCFFDKVSYKNIGDYGAIHLSQASNAIIINNNFEDITHSMVSLDNCMDIQIFNNTATFDSISTLSMGVYGVRGLKNSRIINNRIINVWNEGIILDGNTSNGSVSNNIISENIINANFSGICLNLANSKCVGLKAQKNIISNNIITGIDTMSVAHGIFINNGIYNQVIANSISKTSFGIHILNCSSENLISNNFIFEAKTGIVCGGTGSLLGNQIYDSENGIYLNFADSSIVKQNRFKDIKSKKISSKNSIGIDFDRR